MNHVTRNATFVLSLLLGSLVLPACKASDTGNPKDGVDSAEHTSPSNGKPGSNDEYVVEWGVDKEPGKSLIFITMPPADSEQYRTGMLVTERAAGHLRIQLHTMFNMTGLMVVAYKGDQDIKRDLLYATDERLVPGNSIQIEVETVKIDLKILELHTESGFYGELADRDPRRIKSMWLRLLIEP